jgi:hypothetical protein
LTGVSRKRSTSAKATISSNFARISARDIPRIGAIQIDVLAARELGVEPGPHLEKARHPTGDLDATFRGFR